MIPIFNQYPVRHDWFRTLMTSSFNAFSHCAKSLPIKIMLYIRSPYNAATAVKFNQHEKSYTLFLPLADISKTICTNEYSQWNRKRNLDSGGIALPGAGQYYDSQWHNPYH